MNPAWIRNAAALPPRQLHLLGGGLLLVAAAALWAYALRAPLEALRTVRAEQQRLVATGSDPRLLAAHKAVLDTDIQALSTTLGAASARPAPQLAVALMGEIGRLAAVHGVTLHGATPAPDQKTVAFDQAGIDAVASGSYGALLAWMAAIEAARPNLSIDRFDMRAGAAPGQIDIKVRIASFHSLESTP